jgi:hypothetical protein
MTKKDWENVDEMIKRCEKCLEELKKFIKENRPQ